MTEEAVAPLDAYATAKPDEPVWTVQGGDPLGAPLLRIWAQLARIHCGVLSPTSFDPSEALTVAALGEMPNVREQENLLIRATQTEQVSWDMDSYRRGHATAEDGPKATGENPLDEKARIDLHDLRVRFVSRINNAEAELAEYEEALTARGFKDKWAYADISEAKRLLVQLRGRVEPRRLFKEP